jgi:GrpB-like predicted nucleotidyltransferase (UPF0157 family)
MAVSNTGMYSAFISAVDGGDIAAAQVLLCDPRVDPSDCFNRAIQMAVERGHISMVELLLSDHRVEPSDGNNYAIQMAAQGGHRGTVELLLRDPRVDPTANYNYAIQMAAHGGYSTTVDLLLLDVRVLQSLPATQSALESVKHALNMEHLLHLLRADATNRRIDAIRLHAKYWNELE